MPQNLHADGYNFKFSEDQWLEFARFMDFVFDQQRSLMPDLIKIVMVRSVGVTQIKFDRGLNLSSLSDLLDVPLETTRRKCAELVDAGWLIQADDGYRLGEKVDASVFSMLEANIERLVQTAEKLASRPLSLDSSK